MLTFRYNLYQNVIIFSQGLKFISNDYFVNIGSVNRLATNSMDQTEGYFLFMSELLNKMDFSLQPRAPESQSHFQPPTALAICFILRP